MSIQLGTRPRAIIFVELDDMPFGWHTDPLCFPKLNARMAAESSWLNLPNMRLSTPTCGPSRCNTFMGLRSDHSGAVNNSITENQKGINDCSNWMRADGIYCGGVGKYMNGWAGPNYNFSTGSVIPETSTKYAPRGWDWSGWMYTAGGTAATQYTLYDSYNVQDPLSIVTHYSGTDPGNYMIDVSFVKAIDFVNTYSSVSSGPPVMLWVTPVAPHDPFTPAQRHVSAVVTPFTHRPSVFQTDVSTQPQWIKDIVQLNTAQMNNVTGTQTNKARRCLLSVDDGLDNLIQALIAKGIYNDTLLIFLTDNGNAFGRFTRLASVNEMAKSSNYPEIDRASCLMHWPGQASKTINNVCSTLDFVATWCDLFDISPPSDVVLDGISLVPLVENPNTPWPDYIESCVRSLNSGTSLWWGLNTEDGYIYTEHYDSVPHMTDGTTPIDKELYLPADWDAQINVVTSNPSKASELASKLAYSKSKTEGQRRAAGRPWIGSGLQSAIDIGSGHETTVDA